MADLQKAGFSTVVPTLKASDLQGSKRTVVTIESAVPVPGQGRRKLLLKMRFTEWPDRVYFPNPTGISELMTGLGSETDKWRGVQIPLHVVPTTNPETKEEVEALHVAPYAQWDELLGDAASATKKTTRRRRTTT